MTGSTFWDAAAAAVSLLPEAAARRIGGGAGYIASFTARRRLRMAERHMRRVLGDDADFRGAGRAMFASYGRYWAELFWVRPSRMAILEPHIQLAGREHLSAARGAGRGMILAVAHLGNWEIGAYILKRQEIPVTVVAEFLGDRRAREWFVATRRMLGMDVLLAHSFPQVLQELTRRLKAGGAVALMCDRDVLGTGIEVRFFGETTTLPSGPAVLAERAKVPILPAAVYFLPGRGHRAVVYPPLERMAAGGPRERVRTLTQRIAEAMESLIREAPTQWHLLQPNWPSDRELQ